MKRILIIIGIILLVGITVFSIWYIKNDTLFIGEEKTNVEVKNDDNDNISEKEINNEGHEKEKQIDIITEPKNKLDEYEKNGEALEFNYMKKVVPFICNKNQDWHIGYEPEKGEKTTWVEVEPYVTKTFLKKYNQEQGLLASIDFDEIIGISYDPNTEILNCSLSKRGLEINVQAKLKIIKEDNKHKINDIKYVSIYPNDKEADVLNYYNFDSSIIGLIKNSYSINTEEDGEFKTSEEFQEKFPNNKIFGDQPIIACELFEDEETKLMADYDNKYINVKVKIEADDGYYYWVYYRLNFEVDEYGCLKDCSYKQLKKVRGYKIGEEPEIKIATAVEIEQTGPNKFKNKENTITNKTSENKKGKSFDINSLQKLMETED